MLTHSYACNNTIIYIIRGCVNVPLGLPMGKYGGPPLIRTCMYPLRMVTKLLRPTPPETLVLDRSPGLGKEGRCHVRGEVGCCGPGTKGGGEGSNRRDKYVF